MSRLRLTQHSHCYRFHASNILQESYPSDCTCTYIHIYIYTERILECRHVRKKSDEMLESFFTHRPDIYSSPSSKIYTIRRNWIWTSGTEIREIYLDSMKFSRIKISIIRPFRFQNILVNGNEISRRSVAHIVSSAGDRAYISFLIFFSPSFPVPSTTLSPLYVVWRKLPRSNNDEKLVTDDSRIGEEEGLLLYIVSISRSF